MTATMTASPRPMLRPAPQLAPQIAPQRAPRRHVAARTEPGWIERLAAWADAQPVHHRLGSWQRLGR